MSPDAVFIENVAGFTFAVVWGLVQVWNKIGDRRREKILKKVEKTSTATHILTNSAMAAQLKLNVEFAQQIATDKHRIAGITKEDGDDASAAAADLVVEQQKVLLQAHLVRQATVDEREAQDSNKENK